ncbi:SusC/RagA family TonB-linked outer membrane protein [Pedobacter sp. MC2016-24]|uniref:SusC/RagA family TonB-linked outer membrane protein n=1 Tax=Pedobacter sp. MC2016-24 TaxID=2780090 RepID=UPI001881BD91|nr:SusC/RagA family TonB-linked outer membrane protein [Pedobacter sp. MC2016-24]MBE9598562.1 SusC/RagA family TonB-linked outer membrane protein [Pedobacter sp. MC2016-24]
MIRLTTVILIATFMQVSASSFGQRITLNAKNVPLEKVLKDIRMQSGYDFLFSEALINSSKPISIAVKNASIEEVLEKCFDDQPIVYKVENKTVLLRAKTPSILDKVVAAFAGIDIYGVVVDIQNNPLAGATVSIKDGKRSTTTGGGGQFSLKGVPEDAILQISFMGYVTKEVKANSNLLGIKLELSTSKLDEVQVMAYGKISRRLSTGNIATVTAKELEQQPVQNPLLALQGRVAGMIVTPTNGYASSPVKVEIRGRKTISGDFVSDPLYIVDGVPINNLEVGPYVNYDSGPRGVIQNGALITGGQSPLYNMNSRDIESIEVLKDGDATAIYGSRAANGVILITTKKGKPGETKFNTSLEQGFSVLTQHYDMLNTQQYLEIRREAFKNDNIVPNEVNAPDLVNFDPNKYTDWQKKIWGNIGRQTAAFMSLSGGDALTQFRVSGNYNRQTEILTTKGSNQRAGLSLNLGHATQNRKFRIDVNMMYGYSSVNTTSSPGLSTLPPNAPDIYDAVGNLNFEQWRGAPGSNLIFPFSDLEVPYTSNTFDLKSSLNLRYQVLKNLSIATNIGYNSIANKNKGFVPIRSQDPISNPEGSNFFGTNDNYNLTVEPQIDYKVNIGEGSLTALLGGNLQQNSTSGTATSGIGYKDDDLLESITLAPFSVTTSNLGYYKYAAVFARLNYNWKDKYIINLNGRRDGSSRFGSGNQFGNFGSIGAAWILSKEDWIRNALPEFISFVKLRGSYGLTGSDAVGDYQYLTRWSKKPNLSDPLPDYDGSGALISTQAVNPNYQWQVNKKLEAALSLGFLEDRINFELAFYRDRCGNQLTKYPTPIFTGFKEVTANWPATLENSGWELTMNASLVHTDNFSWNMTLNGSINSNKLIDYPDLMRSPYATKYKIGKSINTQYVLHYLGVDPLSGRYTFEDYDKDGMLGSSSSVPSGTGGDDRYVALDLAPKFSGGFGNTFTYRNFSLTCFFDFRKQYFTDPDYNVLSPIGSQFNQSVAILGNYWKAPGDHAKYAKPTTLQDLNNNYYTVSDEAYKLATYARLNNLSLSYSFNQKLARKLGASSLKANMNAQNVFVLTNQKGINPDIQQFGSLPMAKIFLFGLSLTF